MDDDQGVAAPRAEPGVSAAAGEAAAHARIKGVFLQVIGLPRAEQTAAIERLCHGDAELRREVESLLAYHYNESVVRPQAPGEGTLLGRQIGRIRVEKELGTGGTSTVYLGYDERLHRPVALKALRSGRRMDAETRTRFLLEARILSQLRHEHICEIYGYEETPEGDLLVLEYIDGRSLRAALEVGLSLRERDDLAVTLAEVLQIAHSAGVVHRDLKPENVMLTREGRIKVLDFGIARIDAPAAAATIEAMTGEAAPDGPAAASTTGTLDTTTLVTRAGHVLGTLHYMSPEQARGEPVAPASDIYALGLLLFEVYSGRPAYPRELPLPALLERLRTGLVEPAAGLKGRRRRLIQRMLSARAGERPTAFEVAQELRQIRETPRRWVRRGLITGVLALTVLAAIKYIVDITLAWAQAEVVTGQLEMLGDMLVDDLFNKLSTRDRKAFLDRAWRMPLYYLRELPGPLRGESVARLAQRTRTSARMRLSMGDSAGALAAAERALWLDDLSLGGASEEQWHEQLVTGMATIHSPEEGRAEPTVAVRFYRRARDFYAARLAEGGRDERWMSALAFNEMALGWSHLHQREPDEAVAAFERAEAGFAELARRAASLRAQRWHFLRSEARLAQAEALFHGGRLAAALTTAQTGADSTEALVRELPHLPGLTTTLGQLHLLIGRVQQARGSHAEARQSLEAARALLGPLHEADPGHLRWLVLLGYCYLHAARVERSEGQESAARAALARAEALTADIRSDSLLTARDARAQILLELGRDEDARAFVEPLVAMGWHEDLDHRDFAALARRAGFLPDR